MRPYRSFFCLIIAEMDAIDSLSNHISPLFLIGIAAIIGVIAYIVYQQKYEGFETITACPAGQELGCFKNATMYNGQCNRCVKGDFTEDGKCTNTDGTVTNPRKSDPQCFRIGAVHV